MKVIIRTRTFSSFPRVPAPNYERVICLKARSQPATLEMRIPRTLPKVVLYVHAWVLSLTAKHWLHPMLGRLVDRLRRYQEPQLKFVALHCILIQGVRGSFLLCQSHLHRCSLLRRPLCLPSISALSTIGSDVSCHHTRSASAGFD